MEVVASLLLISGAVLTLLAAIGVFKFRDVFSRLHAATKPATLGLVLILTGTILSLPQPGVATKLVLVILLQFITAPVGSHLIGRAAFRSGAPLIDRTIVDELSSRLRIE